MIAGRSLTGLETGVDYADLSIAAAMSHEHRKTLFALRSAAFASGLAIGPVIGPGLNLVITLIGEYVPHDGVQCGTIIDDTITIHIKCVADFIITGVSSHSSNHDFRAFILW